MAGYFRIGEEKIRPGAYFNVQKTGEENLFGAVDGVVAVLFQSSFGPLGKVSVIEREDGYAQIYGEGGTTDALREALYGGAQKLVACRVGNGGTAETVSLAAATGAVEITAKYPGKMGFTVTVREKLADSSQKECMIYLGTQEFEKVNFAAGGDEVAALVAAMKDSKKFTAKPQESAAGLLTNVSQSAFTAGTDPTVTNADYSAALTEIEKYYFNSLCVDTEDTDIHSLISEFLDRIYESGQFGVGFVAEKTTTDLDDRMKHGAAFDKENMAYLLNAKVMAKETELEGYQVAAYLAGAYAATPSNQSLTHLVIDRYTELCELLTNSQYEAAIQSGCMALSCNTDNKIWLDSSVNTLIHPDEEHDEGWKKLRRVKTRYELMYRVNAQAEALVGKVDNDVNGRSTIVAKLQKICNDMMLEGKLISANVTEDASMVADGDSCWFVIEVIDKDSAERIYLTYYFRFSTLEQ